MSDQPEQPDEGRIAAADEGLVAAALEQRRPAPSRQFTMRLREHLTELEARAHRPARLRLLVAAYISCGALVLALAALGATGHGPFA